MSIARRLAADDIARELQHPRLTHMFICRPEGNHCVLCDTTVELSKKNLHHPQSTKLSGQNMVGTGAG